MLPPELVTPERIKQTEEQNKLVFDALQKSMASNDPIWKTHSMTSKK